MHALETPPLLVRMERFARQISVFALLFAALLGLLMISRGSRGTEVFFLTIAMAPVSGEQ